jgi:hypothetical protein
VLLRRDRFGCLCVLAVLFHKLAQQMNQEFCLTQPGQAGRLVEQCAFARTNPNADRGIAPLWLRGHIEMHGSGSSPLLMASEKRSHNLLV